MEKHFKLTEETIVNEAGVTLYRIEATRDTRHAKTGEKGGFVEREDNLGGEAWVDNNAEVWGEAFVYCYAYVSGNARVYGRAQVYDYAWVGEDARVYDNARIYDSAYVGGHAEVHGQTEVEGMAAVKDEAEVTGHARVVGWAKIGRRAFIEHLRDYCVFQGFGRWKDCPLTVPGWSAGRRSAGGHSSNTSATTVCFRASAGGKTVRSRSFARKTARSVCSSSIIQRPSRAL